MITALKVIWVEEEIEQVPCLQCMYLGLKISMGGCERYFNCYFILLNI